MSLQKRVLFLAMKIPDEFVSELESHGLEVRKAKQVPVPREELLASVGDCEAIFCTPSIYLDKELLDLAPNLKAIGTLSVGHNHIDLGECDRRNIRVGFTPGVLDDPVAEFVVSLTLNTIHRINEAAQAAKHGHWVLGDLFWMCGRSIYQNTVGIFGLGRVGLQIGERLLGFKPSRILYHDIVANPLADPSHFSFVSFDHLLSNSDILICMCSLTPQTQGLFNSSVFAKMKPTSVFINCARGTVVNQADLIQALKTKTIAAAGLDVCDPEPLPAESQLYRLDNCVLTPHIGTCDATLREKMFRITLNNIVAALQGENMPSEIKFINKQ